MKRTFATIAIFLTLLGISFAIFWVYFRQNRTQHTQISVQNEFQQTHFFGGFSIDTPERATKAATDDIQVVFKYGQPPSESDELGQKLQSLHMKVVDGY